MEDDISFFFQKDDFQVNQPSNFRGCSVQPLIFPGVQPLIFPAFIVIRHSWLVNQSTSPPPDHVP